MDWSRYAVGGAAARPDSFTGLDAEFSRRLWAFTQAAERDLGPGLQITSAYRSPEVQARLYKNALAKYGSEAAARKWVAPPGRSKHNTGVAADFAMNGSLLRDADSAEAQWIKENAPKFGLAVPMSWEPWQVELAGARGEGGELPPLPAELGGQTQGSALAGPTGTPPFLPPENALEDPQQRRRRPPQTANMLDPRQFMVAPRPVNKLSFT